VNTEPSPDGDEGFNELASQRVIGRRNSFDGKINTSRGQEPRRSMYFFEALMGDKEVSDLEQESDSMSEDEINDGTTNTEEVESKDNSALGLDVKRQASDGIKPSSMFDDIDELEVDFDVDDIGTVSRKDLIQGVADGLFSIV